MLLSALKIDIKGLPHFVWEVSAGNVFPPTIYHTRAQIRPVCGYAPLYVITICLLTNMPSINQCIFIMFGFEAGNLNLASVLEEFAS